MPVFNGFSPLLGDIGHFWSPNFGRKLGMDIQLQIYKNQAYLRPRGDSQIRVMLNGSQAKAIFMQGSYCIINEEHRDGQDTNLLHGTLMSTSLHRPIKNILITKTSMRLT
jgi:hypothetical protein